MVGHRCATTSTSTRRTVHLGGQGVCDINGNELPVCLALVDHGHHTEDLHLLHLANGANCAGGEATEVDESIKDTPATNTIRTLLRNVDNVNRVIVALGICALVHVGGVLPGLQGW